MIRSLRVAWIAALLAMVLPAASAAGEPAAVRGVIPAPASDVRTEGFYRLEAPVRFEIRVPRGEAAAADDLAAYLTTLGWQPAGKERPDLELRLEPGDRRFASDEAYRLEITPRRMTASARATAGLFYAVQSLLQISDDGRLTDNKGRTVDFRNTIIIMTSNIGSPIIVENFSKYHNETPPDDVIEKTRDEVFDLMKQTIRPEFLNRIDEIVMFTPLTKDDVRQIVVLQLAQINRMLGENGMRLETTDKAIDWLADKGYDPLFGARPIKRTLQKYLVNELSKEILQGTVTRDTVIHVDANKDGLVFKN